MQLEEASSFAAPRLAPRRLLPRSVVNRTPAKREQAFSVDAKKTPALLWFVERRDGLWADVRTNLDPNTWSALKYDEPKPEEKFGGFRHWTTAVPSKAALEIILSDLEKVLDEDSGWRPYPVRLQAARQGLSSQAAGLASASWARLRELEANPTSAAIAASARDVVTNHLTADSSDASPDVGSLAAALLLSPEELIRRGTAADVTPRLLTALDVLSKHTETERQRLQAGSGVPDGETGRTLFSRICESALAELSEGWQPSDGPPSPLRMPPPDSGATSGDPEAAYARLLNRCRELLHFDAPDFGEEDFLRNLFLTVLDFQMHGTAVANALSFFERNRRADVGDIDALNRELARFSDDETGNRQCAQFLWGNNCWTRLEILRRLVAFFETAGVRDQASLRDWVARSTFESHFRGRVRGLAARVYEWLRIRVGVEDIKMDVWVQRFVDETLGPQISLPQAKTLLVRAATELGITPRRLDALIWWVRSGRSGRDLAS